MYFLLSIYYIYDVGLYKRLEHAFIFFFFFFFGLHCSIRFILVLRAYLEPGKNGKIAG